MNEAVQIAQKTVVREDRESRETPSELGMLIKLSYSYHTVIQ